jgi:hypothetical protein
MTVENRQLAEHYGSLVLNAMDSVVFKMQDVLKLTLVYIPKLRCSLVNIGIPSLVVVAQLVNDLLVFEVLSKMLQTLATDINFSLKVAGFRACFESRNSVEIAVVAIDENGVDLPRLQVAYSKRNCVGIVVWDMQVGNDSDHARRFDDKGRQWLMESLREVLLPWLP